MKKHLHHFNRGLLVGFEMIGVFALLLFFSWVALIWRLSQGPMNADFLTARLEKSLNARQSGFEFDVGTTVLAWGGYFDPFEVEMKNVQINRTDKTPVLAVEKIGVHLSKRYLVFGKLVPKEIRIYAPALRVVRQEDGHFALNISGAVPEPGIAPAAAEQGDFVASLMAQMKERDPLGLLGGLKKVTVEGASVMYEDRILQVSWKSKKTDVVFARGAGGIVSDAAVELELDQSHTALFRTKVTYNWGDDAATAILSFSGVTPALIAQQSEKLKDFAGLDFPLKGSLAIAFDSSFVPVTTRFIVGADPGVLNGLSAQSVQVKTLYLTGHLDLRKWSGEIERANIGFDGPKVNARARFFTDGGERRIAVRAELSEMPMDDLARYWPEGLAGDARAWVTGHLSRGVAHKATLDAELAFNPAAEKHISLRKLGGTIDFTNIKVDYFPPLLAVTGVDGRATYDRKSFHLDLKSGVLGDMAVRKSVIDITDLDIQDAVTHSKIAIAATLDGPLKTALKVLDSDPLKYPSSLGLQAGGVGGSAVVDVSFRFPLYKLLTLKEVAVSATARLNDVLLNNVVSDMALTGGPMDLTFKNAALSLKGAGRLGGMPVDFSWTKDFSGKEDAASRVAARLPLDAEALRKLGVPDDLKVNGTMDTDVTYATGSDNTSLLTLKGDIAKTGFTVPVIEKEKIIGVPGTLSLVLSMRGGQPEKITGFHLETENTLIQGAADFRTLAEKTVLRHARFDRIRADASDVSLSVDRGADQGYVLKVSGPQLDISRFMRVDDRPNSDEGAAQETTPLVLSLSVDRLVTGENKLVEKVKMFVRRTAWKRLDQFEMDGIAGKGAIYIRYMPVAAGHTLRFEASNAGAALSALGITGGVRQGKLVVDGRPAAKSGPRDMTGTVMLTDFTLVDAPALARLLNAMSLTGIIELLNGKGIAFKKMRADFGWIDRGPPAEQKNIRMIKVKDGQTSGASLGLTFEGNIDNWNNTYDLNGTIIPVSDLNKILGAIPLVGDVLTAGGEGIFAATYTIQGPKDQPTVTVNPLAALAPGVLRKLFF